MARCGNVAKARARADGRGVRARDARYRWTILAVGVAAQAALSAVTMGLPALAPALRDAFGLSLSEVGLVLASVNWGTVVTSWRGALADRIGERTVIAAGLAGGALARSPTASAACSPRSR